MADGRDFALVLLRKARGDEAALKALLAADVPDAAVGFHAQQAVEKAFKAVLALRGVEFPFTHSLAFLARLLEESGVDLPSELGSVAALQPWAVDLRYEDPRSDEPTLDRPAAGSLAARAVEWAATLVERE